jgi:hypothetical protein
MALFVDGPISSVEDLHGVDTQLLDVASSEGIDVTRKILQAQEEMEIDIRVLLGRLSRATDILADVQNAFQQVVVTVPLKMWHRYRALEMVYRDAFHSQLNDRYAAKRDEYRELTKWAYDKVLQSGLGLTSDPVRRAPIPDVRTMPGNLAAGTYYVAMAWTNAAGEEGASSLPAKIAVAGGSFQVTHGEAPANARGWNVYAGSSPESMFRQNAAVLGLSAVWMQPDVVAASGTLAGMGQRAMFVRGTPRLIERG